MWPGSFNWFLRISGQNGIATPTCVCGTEITRQSYKFRVGDVGHWRCVAQHYQLAQFTERDAIGEPGEAVPAAGDAMQWSPGRHPGDDSGLPVEGYASEGSWRSSWDESSSGVESGDDSSSVNDGQHSSRSGGSDGFSGSTSGDDSDGFDSEGGDSDNSSDSEGRGYAYELGSALYDEAGLTVAQAVYMLYEWKERSRCTDTSFDELVRMLAVALLPAGNKLPRSWYLFKQVLGVQREWSRR